jgi:NAD(P)-dependent dehydrogenase (short-subunit alcohol dehydrogenase family)
LAVTTDFSKQEDIQKLADEAVAKYGRIDVWINDVGVGAHRALLGNTLGGSKPADRC